ncbi:Thioredoxin [Mycoplasmopsis californica]|uniref:Thioredoxin n=1 Tax=Mycoplasmopsis equigenitalium TaxID=114883 RepID=A0ABY5J571_9BACT|nr:thioredoxin family protein [Mycoplasmopsis equigenitalium]UUD37267.1 thioredoxin family protein [Mycoplasmopsis equigenitalium]VEU69424.1 Thioredoxin [Mycoplasmopsis californica]
MLINTTKEGIGNGLDKGLKILNFHAVWCPPCKMLKPVLEELAEKQNLDIYRIDIDENKAFAIERQIASIPTTFIYKDGKEVAKLMGYMSYEDLLVQIEKFK